MSRIPDDLTLGQLNLPGTHDTMTYTPLAFLLPTAQDQARTLKQQLDDGIRLLDLRPGKDYNGGSTPDAEIKHGLASLGVYLRADVFTTCREFLDAHPSETIVMIVQAESGYSGASVHSIIQADVNDHPEAWYTKNVVPTIGEARGKMVLIRPNYPGTLGIDLNSGNDNSTWTVPEVAFSDGNGGTTLGQYRIQVQYALPRDHDGDAEAMVADKWDNYLKPFFDETHDAPIADNVLAVGAPDSGQVYVLDAGTGDRVATLANPTPAAGDRFGASVAAHGNLIVVGAPGDVAGGADGGMAYVYRLVNDAITRKRTVQLMATLANPSPDAGDGFGSHVTIDENTIVVNAPGDDTGGADSGRAYAYRIEVNPTADTATVSSPVALARPAAAAGDRFGSVVALHGGVAVVGAPQVDAGGADSGEVYVFNPSTGQLYATLTNPSPAAGDEFGSAVAVFKNRATGEVRIVVGAPGDDGDAADSGRAYVFRFGVNDSPLLDTLANPSPGVGDRFGSAVAVSDQHVVIGAPGDDTGGAGSGQAYVYAPGTGTAHDLLATVANPSPAAGDEFGVSVAVSGTRVVVGASGDDTDGSDSGRAYQFNVISDTAGTVVNLLGTLANPAPGAGDRFGAAVTKPTGHTWYNNTSNFTYDLERAQAAWLDPATLAKGYRFEAINPINRRLDDYLAALTSERVGSMLWDHYEYRDLSAQLFGDTTLVDRMVDLNFGENTPAGTLGEGYFLLSDGAADFINGIDNTFETYVVKPLIKYVVDPLKQGTLLPMIGDQIDAALQPIIDRIESIRTDVVDSLAALFAADHPVEDLTDLVQQLLFDVLGPDGLDILQDGPDAGGAVNLSDVIVTSGKDINGRPWLQYDFHLGQSLTVNLPSFQLGLDGLAQSVGDSSSNPNASSQFANFFDTFGFSVSSAGIAVDLAWDLRMGFGLSGLVEQAFYVNAGATDDGTANGDAVPELRASLNVHAAPSSDTASYEQYLAAVGEHSNLRMQASLGLVQAEVTDGTPVTLQVSAATPQPDTLSVGNYNEDFRILLDYAGTAKDRDISIQYANAGLQPLAVAIAGLNLELMNALGPLPPVFFTLTYDPDQPRAAFITLVSRDPELEHLSIVGAENYGFRATQYEDFRSRGLGLDNNTFSASDDGGQTQELLAASAAPTEGLLRSAVDMVVWIGGHRATSNGLQVTQNATAVELSLDADDYGSLEDLRAAVEAELQEKLGSTTSLPSTLVTVEIVGDRLKLVSHRDAANGFADAPLLSATYYEVETSNLEVVVSLDITNPDFDEAALAAHPNDQAYFNRVGLPAFDDALDGGASVLDYFVPNLTATAQLRLHVNANSENLTGFATQSLGLASDAIGLPEFTFDFQADASMDVQNYFRDQAGAADDPSLSDLFSIDSVYFNNVTLDVTLFLKTVIGPIASAAAAAVEPVLDVVGNSVSDPGSLLNTRLPYISDILDRNVTIRDVLPTGLQTGLTDFLKGVSDAAKLASDIAGYVQSDDFLRNLTDGGKITFGGFELVMDPDSDFYFPDTHVPIPIGLRDILEQNPDPDDFFNAEFSFDIANPSVFSIDILKPQTAIDYLLGNDVNLFSIGLPSMSFQGSANFGFDFQVLEFNVGGTASFDSNLRLGYDTRGISRIIEAFRAGRDPNWSDLIDGFGITADPDRPELGASVSFNGSGGITITDPVFGTVLFAASGSVDLGAGLRLDITDPDGDGKLRLDEISDLTDGFTRLQNLFLILDIAGSFHFDVSGSATIAGVTFDTGEMGLINAGFRLQDLLSDSFGIGAGYSTPDPILGTVVTDDDGQSYLRINSGAYAGARVYGDVNDSDPDPYTYLVEDASAGNVQLFAADGSDPVTFTRRSDGSYQSPTGEDSTLARVNGLFVRSLNDFFNTKQYFDAAGRLVRVEDNAIPERVTTYAYDGNGRLSRLNRDDGTHATFVHGAQITARSVTGGIVLSGLGVVDQFYAGNFTKIVAVGGDLDDSFDFSNVTGTPIEVRAGKGDDLIRGGSGHDTLYGGEGDDTIHGGAGNDTIDGGKGSNVVTDGLGDDTIDLSSNDVGFTLITSGGNDTVVGSAHNDIITASGAGNVYFLGGDGDDILTGGSGDDLLEGGNGADQLFGLGGSDVLLGGAGDDALDGGSGDDVLHGNEGNDTVKGGLGADRLFGNEGADTLIAGFGDALVDGGDNKDVFRLLGDVAATATLNDGAYSYNGVTTPYVAVESIEVVLGDFTNVLTIDGPTLPLTSVRGGSGNDTIQVTSLPYVQGGTEITLGAGTDVVTVIDTQRPIAVTGGDGNADALIFDRSGAASHLGTLSETAVTLASQAAVFYDTIEILDIRLGADADRFVVSRTQAGVDTTIDGGGGADQVSVYLIGDSTTINGGAGEDTVTVVIPADANDVPPSRFADLFFGGVERLVIDNSEGTTAAAWHWQDGEVRVGATKILDTLGAAATVIQASSAVAGSSMSVADTVAASQTVSVTGNQVTIQEGATVLTAAGSTALSGYSTQAVVDGLAGVNGVVVSPDGELVYAISQGDDALAVFRREANGSLVFLQVLKNGIDGVSGLSDPTSIVVSSDGSHVYVASPSSNAIAIFARDASTDQLSPVGSFALAGVQYLAISPNGQNVYASAGRQLSRLSRTSASGLLAAAQLNFVNEFDSSYAPTNYTGLAVSRDGLYLAAISASRIQRWNVSQTTGMVAGMTQNTLNDGAPDNWIAVTFGYDTRYMYVFNAFNTSVRAEVSAGTINVFGGASNPLGSRPRAITANPVSNELALGYDRSSASSSSVGTELATFPVLAFGATGSNNGVTNYAGFDAINTVAYDPTGAFLYGGSTAGNLIAAFQPTGPTALLATVADGEVQTNNFSEQAGAARVATVISPDGLHAYSLDSRFRALSVADRNPTTGALGGYTQAFQLDGLTGDAHLTISGDGKTVYVTTPGDDALRVYSRDAATGLLTMEQVLQDGDGGVNGLGGARDVAVSPDGKHVYATGATDNAVAVFSRNTTTGLLTFVAAATPADLNGPGDLELSQDGNYLYVTSSANDGVLVFRRDSATGALTHLQTLTDGVGGVDGLDGAAPLALSADATQTTLFVGGQAEDAVAIFRRDAATGLLTFTEVLRNEHRGVRGIKGVTALAATQNLNGSSFLFVSGESETLAVFGKKDDGTWAMLQRVRNGSNLVSGIEAPTDLTVSPDGQHLYIGNGGTTATGDRGGIAHLAIGQSAPQTATSTVAFSGTDSLTVSTGDGADLVTASGVDVPFTLNTNGGADDVVLSGTLAVTVVNLGDDNDAVEVLGTGGAVTINGGSGDDTFTVLSKALGGTLMLNGDGHTTGDKLVFADQAAVSHATVEIVESHTTPSASAGGPYLITEGGTLVLNAGGSTKPPGHADATPVAYEWDLDGDGGFGDVIGVSPTVTWAALQALGLGDSGTYQVAVRYTTNLGVDSYTDIAVATVTVTNTAPTLTLTGAATIEEGQVYSLNLSATDPGDDSISYWVVNWGDGPAPQTYFGNPASATHTYSSAATRTIQVTATDEDGTFPATAGAGITTTVVVTAATRDISGADTATEGAAYTLALTAVGSSATSIQKWLINWGDGDIQEVTGSPGTVQHTYADNGRYTITAKSTEGSGLVRNAASTVQVRVQNVAPILSSVTSNSPVVQGGSLLLTVNATDQGTQDVLTYAFDFNDDGTYEVSGSAASVQKVFQSVGSHRVRVRVSDDDGDSVGATLVINVTNAAPTLGIITVETVNPREGSLVSVRASASDPGGSADPLTYSFDFDNDGDYEVSGPSPVASYKFDDDGLYTIGVKVRDGSGAEDLGSVLVNVANVAPSIVSISTGGRVKEGSSLTLTVTASDPAGSNDPLTYDFDFDNDGTYEVSNATGVATHTFTDNTSNTVKVRVRDDDGDEAMSEATVDVFNVPPEFELGADVSFIRGSTFSRSGSFTDSGADTWTATVDYGDGGGKQPLTLGADKTFQLSHLYNVPDGDYTLEVVISDDDGMRSVDSIKVTVASPSLAPVNVDEGDTVSKSGLISDLGSNAVSLEASVGDITNNGDGTWTWSFTTGNGPSQSQTVTLTAIDGNGGRSTTTFALTVNNLPPVLDTFTSNTSVTAPGAAGAAVTVAGTFSDPGLLDGHTASVSWGDGASALPATVQQTPRTLSGSHTYTAGGIYAVTVTLADEDGATDSASTTVYVTGGRLTAEGELQIVGTNGADTIVIRSSGGPGNLSVRVNGQDIGTFAPTTRIVYHGIAGDDQVEVEAPLPVPLTSGIGTGTTALTVIGGAGDDNVVVGSGSVGLNGVAITLANVRAVSFVGSGGGSDTFIVDYTNGFFSTPLGLDGLGHGALIVRGSAFDTITNDAGAVGAGTLLFHPTTGADATIVYSGLTAIVVSCPSVNVVVNLPAGIADATLVGSDTAGMESIVGFTFADPSSSLTVTGTSSAAEKLNIESLSPSFRASLLIDLAGGADEVTFTGNLSLGEGRSITATANTIRVAGNLITSGGSIVLNAGSLALGASLVATNGVVALTSTSGGITRSAGTVSADTLVLRAAGGIGTAALPFVSAARRLAASGGSGGVFLRNTGNLILADLVALGISGLSASGLDIDVQTSGSLNILADVRNTGPGRVNLDALDQLMAGQNLNVAARVAIVARGPVRLRAGDNLSVARTAIVTTAGPIELGVDFGNADRNVGGVASVLGTLRGASAVLNGSVDADLFVVRPSATTPLTVNGRLPGRFPGDRLLADLAGVAGARLRLRNPGNGTITFARHRALSYTSIEAPGVVNGTLTPVVSAVRLAASRTSLPRGEALTLTAVVNLGARNADDLTGLRVLFRVDGVVVGGAPLARVGGAYQASLRLAANQTGLIRVDAVFLGKVSSNRTRLIAGATSNALEIVSSDFAASHLIGRRKGQ